MTDGLYLNKTWVAEVDAILTLQANDLSKPDSIQSTYALNFDLPDNLTIRTLTGNAEQVDAGGPYPYAPFTAMLVSEGNPVFRGIARLMSFQGGWKVNLFGASKGMFDQLSEMKLRDLDLSRYDHPWTPGGMSSFAGAVNGVIYPVIDYGNFDGTAFASDAVFPAVYVHTLVRQMLSQVGYRPGGNWLDDELIRRLALPFVNDSPQSKDQQWIDDRTAMVTVSKPWVRPGTFDDVLHFDVDNQAPAYYDGKLNNFKPELNAYVCDTSMRLRVQAYQMFSVYISQGAVEAMLIVEKNSERVKQAYWSESGPYNITSTGVDSLSLDE